MVGPGAWGFTCLPIMGPPPYAWYFCSWLKSQIKKNHTHTQRLQYFKNFETCNYFLTKLALPDTAELLNVSIRFRSEHVEPRKFNNRKYAPQPADVHHRRKSPRPMFQHHGHANLRPTTQSTHVLATAELRTL
ncbi:hypothetical protein Pelo_18291 [Pelomyxa schiedti]|nr:hypothetical protein Pelo_18291 [Pelomyxa schiedti]